jgi:hypothetical protein
VILAARASALSLVAHAVEDAGAVCGARPQGRWRLTERIPVNCPRCLLRLSVPRFALCRIPVPSRRNDVLHVRLVGGKGFKPRGALDTNTLCGRSPMLDERLLSPREHLDRSEVCPRCIVALPAASDGRFGAAA